MIGLTAISMIGMMTARIEWLDAAKGVGLFAFVMSHFMSMGYPSELMSPLEDVQRFALWFGFNLVTGKVTALFAIMFGLALWFQLRGSRPPGRVYLRLVVLGLLGVLHGVFLFWGDILFYYAIAGAVVVLLRLHVRMLGLSAFLASIPFLLFNDLSASNSFPHGVFEMIEQHGYLGMVQVNMVVYAGRLADLGSLLAYIAYLSLGYWIGSSGWVFLGVRHWRRVAFALLPVVAVGGFLSYAVNDFYNAFGLANGLFGWAFGLFYLACVASVPSLFSLFGIMGNRTLSFYLSHSVLLMVIFVICGLYGLLQPLAVVGLAVLVGLVLCVVYSSGLGPAEGFVRLAVGWLERLLNRKFAARQRAANAFES